MTIWKNRYYKINCNLDFINAEAQNSPVEFINKCENNFRQNINVILDYILSSENNIKFIMLSGPSSSGKTTLSKIIRSELSKKGFFAEVMSLDDFYRGYENVPLLEDGTHDFESIDYLDIDKIHRAINDIKTKGFADIPIYDFSIMNPSNKKKRIEMPKKVSSILIVEGLHALNPVITSNINQSEMLKIYVNAVGEVNGDIGTILTTNGIRFMRRVLRDYNYRNALPTRTVLMWKNVCRGEQLYISEFENISDISVNSFHPYEPCVMAKKVYELLKSIPKQIDIGSEYIDLFYNLKKFSHIDESLVPCNSLIREFI